MAYSPDPDVLAVMDRVVDVQQDANFAGAAKSAHGGVPRGAWPVVTGGAAVPCHPVFGRARVRVLDLDGQPVGALVVKWLFAAPVALDVSHRLAYADPDKGVTRYFYVMAPSAGVGRNPERGGQPFYWSVETFERGRVVTPLG